MNKKLVVAAIIASNIMLVTLSKTTKDSFNREYTCNGEGVDCIFNVGADMTSAYTRETDPNSIGYKRLKVVKQTTLNITNSYGKTVAAWPIPALAPATVIARITEGKQAQLIIPGYVTRVFIVEDSLMNQAALETKNGPAAFEAKLTELDPARTNWTVDEREQRGAYLDTINPAKKWYEYYASAQVLKMQDKLVYKETGFGLMTPR
jgi:hypothetical protein